MKEQFQAAVAGGRGIYTLNTFTEYAEFMETAQHAITLGPRRLVTPRYSVARLLNDRGNVKTAIEERERWSQTLRLHDFQAQHERPMVNRMTVPESETCRAVGRLLNAVVEQAGEHD